MNHSKQRIRQDFDRASAGYDAHASLQQCAALQVLALAENLLPEDARVLDTGAGTGFLARHAPRGWRMVQVDIAVAMCRASSAFAPAAQADMEVLPFRDATFDGMISSLALQWSEHPAATFAEAARVLKPRGTFVFATLGHTTLQELREAFAAVTGAAHGSTFPAWEELDGLLRSAGFGAVSWQEKMLREEYPDTLALMRSVKAVGAANKREDRRQPLTKGVLAAVEEYYGARHKTEQGGIAATWQIHYAVARKE